MSQSVDATQAAEIDKIVMELASDPNPMNRYQLAQILAFGVNELQKQDTNLLQVAADVKRSSIGQKVGFRVNLNDVRAYVQAKGSTTARSIIANKQIVLDTVEVSARPVMNLIELAKGEVKMSDLIREAHERMQSAHYGLIQKVINDSVTEWKTPFYGTGSGLVKTTLDTMLNFWKRTGKVAILGDIEVLSQLSELTGFAAATGEKAFSDQLIGEHNDNGYLGKYNGANVVSLTNPYESESALTPVFDTNKLYMLPAAADASMRPLKVVYEGDVQQTEMLNIDNGCMEVCLRQFVGAGMVHGQRPYMSVYEAQ